MMVCKTALMLLLVQAAGLAPVATKPAPVATQQQTALSAPGLVAASNEDLEAVVGTSRRGFRLEGAARGATRARTRRCQDKREPT